MNEQLKPVAQPKRFLVKACGGGLGDIAVSLPTCRVLASRGHHVELYIYRFSRNTLLTEGCDFLEAVHIDDRGDKVSPVFDRLTEKPWEAILDLMSRDAAPKNIGKAKLYKTRVDMDKSLLDEGKVIYCSSILKVGLKDWRSKIQSEIPIIPARYESALRIAQISENKSYATVAPGTSSYKKDERRWPIEKFAEVIRYIKASYSRVYVVGSRRETDLCEELAGICGVESLASKVHLLEACALVSGTALHIGNDSGLGHIAAGYRRPTLAIGGSKRFKPYEQTMIPGDLADISPDKVIRVLKAKMR